MSRKGGEGLFHDATATHNTSDYVNSKGRTRQKRIYDTLSELYSNVL